LPNSTLNIMKLENQLPREKKNQKEMRSLAGADQDYNILAAN